MARTREDLDAVEAAIALGVTEVRFSDRSVKFRSLDELRAIRDSIAQDMAGGAAVSRIVVRPHRGL